MNWKDFWNADTRIFYGFVMAGSSLVSGIIYGCVQLAHCYHII